MRNYVGESLNNISKMIGDWSAEDRRRADSKVDAYRQLVAMDRQNTLDAQNEKLFKAKMAEIDRVNKEREALDTYRAMDAQGKIAAPSVVTDALTDENGQPVQLVKNMYLKDRMTDADKDKYLAKAKKGNVPKGTPINSISDIEDEEERKQALWGQQLVDKATALTPATESQRLKSIAADLQMKGMNIPDELRTELKNAETLEMAAEAKLAEDIKTYDAEASKLGKELNRLNLLTATNTQKSSTGSRGKGTSADDDAAAIRLLTDSKTGIVSLPNATEKFAALRRQYPNVSSEAIARAMKSTMDKNGNLITNFWKDNELDTGKAKEVVATLSKLNKEASTTNDAVGVELARQIKDTAANKLAYEAKAKSLKEQLDMPMHDRQVSKFRKWLNPEESNTKDITKSTTKNKKDTKKTITEVEDKITKEALTKEAANTWGSSKIPKQVLEDIDAFVNDKDSKMVEGENVVNEPEVDPELSEELGKFEKQKKWQEKQWVTPNVDDGRYMKAAGETPVSFKISNFFTDEQKFTQKQQSRVANKLRQDGFKTVEDISKLVSTLPEGNDKDIVMSVLDKKMSAKNTLVPLEGGLMNSFGEYLTDAKVQDKNGKKYIKYNDLKKIEQIGDAAGVAATTIVSAIPIGKVAGAVGGKVLNKFVPKPNSSTLPRYVGERGAKQFKADQAVLAAQKADRSSYLSGLRNNMKSLEDRMNKLLTKKGELPKKGSKARKELDQLDAEWLQYKNRLDQAKTNKF